MHRRRRCQEDLLALRARVFGLEVELDPLGGGVYEPLVNALSLMRQHDPLPRAVAIVDPEPVAGVHMVGLTLGHLRLEQKRLAARMDPPVAEHLVHERFDTGARRPGCRSVRGEQTHEARLRRSPVQDRDGHDHGQHADHGPGRPPGSIAADHPGQRLAGKPALGLLDAPRGQRVALIQPLHGELDARGEPPLDRGKRPLRPQGKLGQAGAKTHRRPHVCPHRVAERPEPGQQQHQPCRAREPQQVIQRHQPEHDAGDPGDQDRQPLREKHRVASPPDLLELGDYP